MSIDVVRLYERLPHAGSMRLIDEITDWDSDSIRCVARNHRDPAHPLRTGSGLRAVCAIEYAAQAAALHAQLVAGEDAFGGDQPRALLALVTGLDLDAAYLHDGDGDLVVAGGIDYRHGDAVVYRFEVHDGSRRIAHGRLGLTS